MLCIDTNKIELIWTIWTKDSFYLVALILSKKTMVNKHTGQVLSNGLTHHDRSNRRIHTPRESTECLAISHFFLNGLDAAFYKCIHFPIAITAADKANKVSKHFCSLCCVQYLRMKLNGIEILFHILCCCYWAVLGMCHNLKFRCYLFDIIRMTHPYNGLFLHIFKEFALFVINDNLCLSILAHWCLSDMSIEKMLHHLCTIAKSKYWDAKLK